MKRSCLRCDRTSPSNSLFCHEVDCPAERSPAIFEAGDRLGDIEIVRTVSGLRSATVYEAVQQQRPVFMKVAHPGTDHRDRLIREASFLRSTYTEKKNARNPALPVLRAPYTTTTIDQDAVGTVMQGRDLLNYYLFDPVEGRTLQELLLQQPQWWINHVGWLSIEFATALNSLHLKGFYHFGLTPASVLVRFDDKSFTPHVVLCDLGIASDAEDLPHVWYPDFVSPAYTAPELLGTKDGQLRASVQSDVYGLGLVLYEMLVGQPVYADALVSDARVIEAVRSDHRPAMGRVEDVSPVAEIALRAASADAAKRPPTAADVVEELTRVVGDVPIKKSRPVPGLNVLFLLGGAALVVAFLVSLAVTLSSGLGQ